MDSQIFPNAIEASTRRELTVKRVQTVNIMQKNILSGSKSEQQRNRYILP